MGIPEGTLRVWAQSPGTTEEQRIENTVRAIRRAVENDDKLRYVSKVYILGSYRNRVNVRQDSDVDVGILYKGGSFGVSYPPGKSHLDFGNFEATYTYSDFKDDVGWALMRHFGAATVRRGNKAFDIHENTYRVDADVVPMFVHRRYSDNGDYMCGVQLNPDNGDRIVNWPEKLDEDPHWPTQHYENGVAKNMATGRRYKGVVRIMKHLRNKMDAIDILSARPISGFFAECLVWNVPNSCFGHATWSDDLQAALIWLWFNTMTDEKCSEWREVSELKFLFRGSPKSKREQAHAFINVALNYVGVR